MTDDRARADGISTPHTGADPVSKSRHDDDFVLRVGAWRPLFLAALRNSGNVRAACQAAGINRMTAYNHRRRSREFAEAWSDALEDAVDVLEAIVWTRAKAGSDTLLMFLLRHLRPSIYRDTINIEISLREAAEAAGLDADEAIAEAKRLLREARAKT